MIILPEVFGAGTRTSLNYGGKFLSPPAKHEVMNISRCVETRAGATIPRVDRQFWRAEPILAAARQALALRLFGCWP